ncbi:HNH endonuclease [Marnyiella aurantia]|uniref:HNH endonuclease n=1 Tax=Marnyiella aurantia TaxID=2758037 RepID=A0A7D7LQV3_9FLAO|nr:HNH endonuclease signature motif containing protein [Marnyiella aurantia]MBA5245845.1 HNH endonuclease [Marnyiella aurantia]QMS98754.1 HNH endonuclease [Marnyiella aurantia]
MIYDFRKGHSAQYFSKLLTINYDFDVEEITLSREQLQQDEIGYFKRTKNNGMVRLGAFLPQYKDITYASTPALHIYQCETTEEKGFKMQIANSSRNNYWSRDRSKHVQAELQICKVCAKHLRNHYKISMGTNTFNNFILALEESSRTKQTLVDSSGYIINWRQVSHCFRDLKRFTCEKCGYKANNEQHYKYLHTHHISGVKTDNQRSNLQCLCVKCHSEVDDHHQKKFALEGLSQLLEFEQIRANIN